MTNEELIQLMRYCASGTYEMCQSCQLYTSEDCSYELLTMAADRLERTTQAAADFAEVAMQGGERLCI